MTTRSFLAATVMIIALTTPMGVSAQTVLRVDGDKCTAALKNAAVQFGGLAHLSSTPRQIAGKCEANDVRISELDDGVALTIDRLRWQKGSLAPFAKEQFPTRLFLEFSGVSVQLPQGNEPILRAMRRYFSQGNKFDAEIRWAYQAGDNKLSLNKLLLDFGQQNTLAIAAKLENLSEKFMSRPEIYAAALTMAELDIGLRGNRRLGNEVVKTLLAAGTENGQSAPNNADLKSQLADFVQNNLGEVFGADSRAAANRLISDIPHPSGSLSLKLRADPAKSLLKLALLAEGAAIAKIFSGTNVDLNYSPWPGG